MNQSIQSLIPKLTVTGVISNAWKHVNGTKWAIWLPTLVMIAISTVFAEIERLIFHTQASNILRILFQLPTAFAIAPLFAGIIMVAVRRLRQQDIGAGSGFQYFSKWLMLGAAYIIANLASFLIMWLTIGMHITLIGSQVNIISFIIAFILTIIVGILLCLTAPAIADKDMPVIEALVFSAKKTVKHIHTIFGIQLINILIVFAFFIPAVIGHALQNHVIVILGLIFIVGFAIACVWFIPYYFLCLADIYNKLTKDT